MKPSSNSGTSPLPTPTPTPTPTSELHLHLYGCLTAEDVWSLGKDRWEEKTDFLDWYETEYEKAWGRRPDAKQYWQDGDQGLEKLKKDFLFTKSAPFPCFQANFNLMIALFKIKPNESYIFEKIMGNHRDQGLKYVEYRTVMPPWFSESELDQYFSTQTRAVRDFNAESKGQFEAKIAYSLQRDPEVCAEQYPLLKDWMKANRSLAKEICGIDFSYFEEGFPPNDKITFIEQLKVDNKADPELALAVLYHVGESFEHLSIESAARWVWQANEAGADRLGHGIALGIDPKSRSNSEVQALESKVNRIDHLEWIIEKEKWLKNLGYEFEVKETQKHLEDVRSKPDNWNYASNYDTDEAQSACRSFQDALIRDLVAKNAIIESCPSSNFRIGMIKDPSHHPLKRFVDSHINLCISTDDPGIFDIDLGSEFSLCQEQLGISATQMNKIIANSARFESGMLSGRLGSY